MLLNWLREEKSYKRCSELCVTSIGPSQILMLQNWLLGCLHSRREWDVVTPRSLFCVPVTPGLILPYVREFRGGRLLKTYQQIGQSAYSLTSVRWESYPSNSEVSEAGESHRFPLCDASVYSWRRWSLRQCDADWHEVSMVLLHLPRPGIIGIRPQT